MGSASASPAATSSLGEENTLGFYGNDENDDGDDNNNHNDDSNNNNNDLNYLASIFSAAELAKQTSEGPRS